MNEQRALLTHLFHVAIKAADPYLALKPHFPKEKPRGRTLVVGFGKGAVMMAQAFEKLWQEAGWGACEGLIVAPYGQEAQFESWELMHAAHPVPDENSIHAGQRMRQVVTGLGENDQLIALVSGGGSALLVAPAQGLEREDKIALNQALLASGAPIHVMNAIRRKASLIKGGRLRQLAHPAKVISYIISDVPGDDPALVSSGPTVRPATETADVLSLIRHYHIALPPRLEQFLKSVERFSDKNCGKTQEREHFVELSETKNTLETFFIQGSDKPLTVVNHQGFVGDETYLVASARSALLAARDEAKRQGLKAILLSDALEGEARDIASMHAALAREIKLYDQPFPKPVLLLSGGETTVTLSPSLEHLPKSVKRFSDKRGGKNKELGLTLGQGGRNSEFALALSQALAGLDDITALAADTDGIDGMTPYAGAFCDGGTVARLWQAGIDPLAALRRHDSAGAFAQIGDVFTTGPTGTNINDFRAILIE